VTAAREVRFWAAGAAAVLLVLWLLNDILLPFAAGAVVALLFDPVVARCQRLGLSRSWSTTLVVGVVALLTIALVVALVPLLLDQAAGFARDLPARIAKLGERTMPLLEPLHRYLGMPSGSMQDLQQAIADRAGEVLAWLGAIAPRLLGGSFAFFNLMALVFLTPVVAFYLLRDWPRILARLDSFLPREHAQTIRRLVDESHIAVAGYLRGQAMVCLTLGAMYALGLALVGLEFGIVIGIIAGVISIVPFVGTFTGSVLAMGMALAQFPPDWLSVGEVAAVFIIGQFVEGNILAPKLVGDSVGLHPVWIMFALLAGGSLFGFTGVLVAVPIAAVLGVLVRFAMRRYLASPYYSGGPDGADDS